MVFSQIGIVQPPANPESKPRRMLSDVVHETLRAGHYAHRTEEAYLARTGMDGMDGMDGHGPACTAASEGKAKSCGEK
jgi:hypothetical protein